MSAGFGFSVGDFIAALKIVSDVIDALRDSGDSSNQCRSLIRQLFDLETALLHVRRLELDDSQADQANALRRSALQCRVTIDEFMTKIRKYQPHLLHSGSLSGSTMKQAWYKVKWALCRQEDLEKFKADLTGHTQAINVLMNAIQLQNMTVQSRTQSEQHLSLKGLIQDCFSRTMRQLSAISDAMMTSISHSKQLLQITAQTAQTDCKIFGVVLDIQNHVKSTIAPQILRSQPVYFVDAFGTEAPFFLEFIQSREAFLSVLQCNMTGNEMAFERIKRGEFAISDVATQHDINLFRPWHMCFRPGQKVDMSMILDEVVESTSTCPSCKYDCAGSIDQDTICARCGLTFRRVTELDNNNASNQKASIGKKDQVSDEGEGEGGSSRRYSPDKECRKRKRGEEITEELVMYRKVRLLRQQAFHHVVYEVRGELPNPDDEIAEEKSWPRKGKTRMPKRLVETKVLYDLGYPFHIEVSRIYERGEKPLRRNRMTKPLLSKRHWDETTSTRSLLKAESTV